MDFNTIPLFGIMKAKLNYLTERQGVLAQNVANADTPGYKAQDIAEPDFSKMVGLGRNGGPQTLRMTTTNPGHIATSPGQAGNYQTMKRPATDELNPNGNNVVIEEEMSKVSLNQAEYQKVLNLYGKTITMFKTALGNSNTGS